jgi:hypothetical protein
MGHGLGLLFGRIGQLVREFLFDLLHGGLFDGFGPGVHSALAVSCRDFDLFKGALRIMNKRQRITTASRARPCFDLDDGDGSVSPASP